VERRLDTFELRVAERCSRIERSESGREQEAVALAQRHVESASESHHHLSARLRAAGLDEADVTRCGSRVRGEIELTDPAHSSPVTKQLTDPGRSILLRRQRPHADTLGAAPSPIASLRGNRARSDRDSRWRTAGTTSVINER